MRQRSRLTLTSEHDPYLYLFAGDRETGRVLLENDDIDSENVDSRITARLDAGNYTIEATTYSAAATGEFSLGIVPLRKVRRQLPGETWGCSGPRFPAQEAGPLHAALSVEKGATPSTIHLLFRRRLRSK